MHALTARQISMAERTATKINTILETHVRRGDVARFWAGAVGRARALFATLPDRAEARLKLLPGDAQIIGQLVDEALEDLVVSDEDLAMAKLPALPPELFAVVDRNVMSLAAARAQTARLQARWIDLKQRIAKGA